jgi:mannose-6-phosphate isomerase
MPPDRPLTLAANQPKRFYRGGTAISAFRGETPIDAFRPEDWVGATSCVFGSAEIGPTILQDGRTLKDAIQAAPEAWLGPGHVRRFGADPALLVKLLDAGQRLPVHAHPDDAFAQRHLDSRFGKSEAWVIVATATDDAAVYLGFQDGLSEHDLRSLAGDRQDELLERLNRVAVTPGDSFFVPAGTPHAIGEGVFMVELQEPTDLSVMLEWADFDIDGPGDAHLGLEFDTALACVDRSAWTTQQLATLSDHRRASHDARVRTLFQTHADTFFQAQLIELDGSADATVGACFAIVVVLDGSGELRTSSGHITPLSGGATLLVPYGAGDVTLSGSIRALRCLPPSP